MSNEIPPGAVASLDQYFAEAKDKYHDLVEVLRKLVAEHGMYEGLAMMTKSLDVANQPTLISMVVTGLYVEMLHGEKEPGGESS